MGVREIAEDLDDAQDPTEIVELSPSDIEDARRSEIEYMLMSGQNQAAFQQITFTARGTKFETGTIYINLNGNPLEKEEDIQFIVRRSEPINNRLGSHQNVINNNGFTLVNKPKEL